MVLDGFCMVFAYGTCLPGPRKFADLVAKEVARAMEAPKRSKMC